MRVISTGDARKVALIAATIDELRKLKWLELTKDFNDSISTEPQKSDKFQCFMMVYTFETTARAKVFRLAYAMARKNGKLKAVWRVKSRPPSYYKRLKNRYKETIKRRTKRKACKRERKRYYKLVPLVRAGNIATLEAKARAIAREALIADLL
jgi:transposase